MNRFKFVLESRGIVNSVERSWQVASRFGPTASRMERRLLAYVDVLAHYGARPSLPMTARVLARNPHVARRLVERGAELCVHALVHTDLTKLPPKVQAEHIAAARAIFREHGVPHTGFRSPYLKYDGGTLDAVRGAGFEYDSNLPFLWGPLKSLEDLKPHERDGLERGLRFYRPVRYPGDRSLPRFIGDLVEIPVSLPDDEILLDRMVCPPEKLGAVWQEMLDLALAREEMLTLQLHPERVAILDKVLRGLLDSAAASGRVWVATLGEIARWWRERAGATLAVEPSGPGAYAVGASAPRRAKVYLVNPAKASRRELVLPARVASDRVPLVGVDPGSGDDLRMKIRELGYLLEVKCDRAAYGVDIKAGSGLQDVEAAIAAYDGPLLADGFWPEPFTAALAATGDIDCLTLGDFLRRFWEG